MQVIFEFNAERLRVGYCDLDVTFVIETKFLDFRQLDVDFVLLISEESLSKKVKAAEVGFKLGKIF